MELKLEKPAAPIKIIVKNNNNTENNVISRCESLLGQNKRVLYTQIHTSAGLKIVKLILDQQQPSQQLSARHHQLGARHHQRSTQTLLQTTRNSRQPYRSYQTVLQGDGYKQQFVKHQTYTRQLPSSHVLVNKSNGIIKDSQVKVKEEPGVHVQAGPSYVQQQQCKVSTSPSHESSEMLCTICGESFTQKYAFSSHIKNHLREKIERRLNKGCKKFTLKPTTKLEPLDTDLPMKSSPKPSLTCFPIKDEPDFALSSNEHDSPRSEISVDIPNDISQILDEIEKNLDKPIKEKLEVLDDLDISLGQGIDTPPDSESEGCNDVFSINDPGLGLKLGLKEFGRLDASTPVDPRILLNHNVDHDYLLPSPISASGAESPISELSLSPRSQASNSQIVNFDDPSDVCMTMMPPATTDESKNILPVLQSNSVLSLGKYSLQDILKHVNMNNNSELKRPERVILHKYNINPSLVNLLTAPSSQEPMDLDQDSLQKVDCKKSVFMGQHLEIHQKVGRCFSCSHCKATFSDRIELRNHEVGVHNAAHKVNQQKFVTGVNNQRHMKNVNTSSNLNMTCSECGARFNDLAKLELHKRVHSDSRRELCGVCGGKFSSKSDMITHMQKRHSQPTSVATANTLKSHTCSICHKTFTQKSHLNRHLKIHGGNLSLQCGVCNKQCVSKTDLTRHRASHVSCNICGKHFDTNVHLQNHTIETHSRELTLTLASPDTDDPLMEEQDLSISPTLSSNNSSNNHRMYEKSSPTDVQTGLSSVDSSFVDDIVLSCSPAPSSTYSDSMDSNFLLPGLDSDSLYLDHENTKPVQNFSVSDISDTSFFDANHQIEEDILQTDFFP